jgi:hypothetical protein
MARKLRAILAFQLYDKSSRQIQQMFRTWRARKIRKFIIATREAAAPIIQRCFRAWRFREYLRRMRQRALVARAQALDASKEHMKFEQHKKLIDKLINRGEEVTIVCVVCVCVSRYICMHI